MAQYGLLFHNVNACMYLCLQEHSVACTMQIDVVAPKCCCCCCFCCRRFLVCNSVAMKTTCENKTKILRLAYYTEHTQYTDDLE